MPLPANFFVGFLPDLENKESMSNVYAVIMAGGSGTRFWPASREMRPKQLLEFRAGEASLLAATVERLLPLVPASHQYVVTAARLGAETEAAVPGLPPAQVLREPAPRNTAPCVAWATWEILARDPDARIMVLPSDHVIERPEAFRAVLEEALAGADLGRLTTVGIVPTRPETGYGYIEVGAPLERSVHEVARFVEKPDLTRAQEYVASGKYLWNAGMFFFRAKDMEAAVRAHLPEVAKGLDAIRQNPASLPDVFPTLTSISVDHGVMEKAGNLAVVKGDFGWNDVGSWQSAWELAAKDAHGNALPEGGVAIDATGNLVRRLTNDPSPKMVALVGVHDLVVVDTGDALLVMPRERAQDVRLVVEALKAQTPKRFL